MLTHIVDTVIVMNPAVFSDFINCAQTILDDHDRNLVAIVNLVENISQSQCIDLPSPVGRFEIRILNIDSTVALCCLSLVLCKAYTVTGIVADADEVNSAVSENLRIFGKHFYMHIMFCKIPVCKSGISSAHMYISGN